MGKEKDYIRNEILGVTKNNPKTPIEILEELIRKRINGLPRINKLKQNYLTPLIKKGELFEIENNEENKKFLNENFNIVWRRGKNYKEFSAYYIHIPPEEKFGSIHNKLLILKKIFTPEAIKSANEDIKQLFGRIVKKLKRRKNYIKPL